MHGINKIIGGFLGFLLAGPMGSLLGILLGHIFDKNFYNQYDASISNRNFGIQPKFFETTFLVMGYVAKLEGVVSQASIDNARKMMNSMHLSESACLEATYLFNQGKKTDFFEVKIVLEHLLSQSYKNPMLLRQFLIIQTQAAIENGTITEAKRKGLINIYQILGVSPTPLEEFEPFTNYYKSYQNNSTQQHRFHDKKNHSFNPYQILGISKNASNKEIKHAYRRLLNQFHPDKLSDKGLSQLERKQAEQKFSMIQKAYSMLCKQKGFA